MASWEGVPGAIRRRLRREGLTGLRVIRAPPVPLGVAWRRSLNWSTKLLRIEVKPKQLVPGARISGSQVSPAAAMGRLTPLTL